MITQIITTLIENTLKTLGIEAGAIKLEHPDNTDHGDFSTNIALTLSKQLGKSPRDIAQSIKEEASKNLPPEISKIEIAGPGFINFFLSPVYFVASVKDIIAKADSFGKGDSLKGQTWLIEHTSPNPNKAMHLGHLRNNITGMAVSNIIEWNGANVIRDAVNNNRGIAIAKLMWGYLKFARKDGAHMTDISYWASHQFEWLTPEEAGKRPDRFVDDLYVKGSEDFKDPNVETVVRNLVVQWEAGDSIVWALWTTVLDYSLQGQKMTLDRLGNRWNNVWHEHEHYKLGKELVEEGLTKGIFKKLEDGAVLSQLEKYNIPDTILVKSDGTSLYITQDLALTKLKKEKFNADKMIWVIGPDQSLAMKQVFAISEQLGVGKLDDFIHLSYGYMSIKGQGKMSSRAGTVIYTDDVIDEAKNEIKTKVTKEFTPEELETVAEQVALGAVKYSILKSGRTTDTAFDFATSLEVEGDSGPYLQYTYTRAKSLLQKGSDAGLTPSTDIALTEDFGVEKKLYQFEEVVARAAQEFAPNYITTYLIELASSFNSFYGKHKIVDQTDPMSPYKLALTLATATVIKNGLTILGIPTPEKM